jgi:hypothetical protein
MDFINSLCSYHIKPIHHFDERRPHAAEDEQQEKRLPKGWIAPVEEFHFFGLGVAGRSEQWTHSPSLHSVSSHTLQLSQ